MMFNFKLTKLTKQRTVILLEQKLKIKKLTFKNIDDALISSKTSSNTAAVKFQSLLQSKKHLYKVNDTPELRQ